MRLSVACAPADFVERFASTVSALSFFLPSHNHITVGIFALQGRCPVAYASLTMARTCSTGTAQPVGRSGLSSGQGRTTSQMRSGRDATRTDPDAAYRRGVIWETGARMLDRIWVALNEDAGSWLNTSMWMRDYLWFLTFEFYGNCQSGTGFQPV